MAASLAARVDTTFFSSNLHDWFQRNLRNDRTVVFGDVSWAVLMDVIDLEKQGCFLSRFATTSTTC